MFTAAYVFVITLVSIVTASTDSFLRCISCPCGLSNRNYTQCSDETNVREFTCERWSHCQTCKANTTFCITCRPGYFGPTCSEISDVYTRRKRQNDPNVPNRPRYPRQSGSDKYSQIRCLNPGPIFNGRVIVIVPFDYYYQPSEEDDDFDFPYGTRLKYKCNYGFFLLGKGTLRCGSNGYWTETIPECVGVSNEHARRKRQNVSDVHSHSRYPRDLDSGKHSETRCLNHGTISDGRVIVILPFDDRSQPSEDEDDFDFPYGTRLKYMCNEGFVLVGKGTLRCGSNGYWTESIPECVGETPRPQETCKHPGVDVNGRIKSPPVDPRRRRQQFPVGTELTFVCNDGFEPEGATVLACLRNGQWTSLPPKCRRTPTSEVVELPCRHPGMVINGMFNGDFYKSSFPVGTAVTFHCIEGTHRKGPLTIVCQRDGKWSEPPPSCETKDSER